MIEQKFYDRILNPAVPRSREQKFFLFYFLVDAQRRGLFAQEKKPAPSARDTFGTTPRLLLGGAFILFTVLAIVAHIPALQADFLASWGDNAYVLDNELVRDFPGTLPSLLTQTHIEGYTPVAFISLGLDQLIWGTDATGFHMMNLVLHIINMGLVMLLISRLFQSSWATIIAAGIYTLHPVQVESIMWISQRGLLLSTLFMLLAMLAHVHSRRTTKIDLTWQIVTWVLFALAIFSKPLVAFGVLVFVAYDALWTNHKWSVYLPYNAPQAVLGGLAGIAAILVQNEAGTLSERFGNSPFDAFILLPWVIGDYVLSLLLPFGPFAPNNLYLYEAGSLGLLDFVAILAGVFAILAVLVLGVWAPLGQRISIFSSIWIVAMLLPVINIMPQEFERADRYLYLPSIMIFGLVGIVAAQALASIRSVNRQYIFLGSAVIVLLIAGGLSFFYSSMWENDDTLWEAHLDRYPNSVMGLEYQGIAQFDARDIDSARNTFERLLEVDADNVVANRYLGVLSFRQEDYLAALEYYSTAHENAPEDDEIENDLGATYFQLGLDSFEAEDYQVALSYYSRALRYIPEEPILHNNIGFTYYTMNDFESAVIAFTSALQLNPTYGRAWANLGNSTLAMEDYLLTRDAYQRALELDVELDALAYSNYCLALAELGEDPQLAADMCSVAVNREPDNGLFLGRTAHMLLIFNQNEQALGFAQRAVVANPGLSLNYRTLGDALARLGDLDSARTAYETALQIDPTNRSAQAGLQQIDGSE